MTTLLYTDAAARDLIQITLHIAADNPHAARRFVDRIRERCAPLVRFPEMGPERRTIAPHVRSLVYGSYVIYYTRLEAMDEVRILRIWHGRRKWPTAADLF